MGENGTVETKKSSDSVSNAGSSKGDAEERTGWGNQLEFFFSCVGYAVGLGNIWRFPYLTFQYGGGAFLIPYVIMLFLCGLPLFFLELSFGQFASLGPITIWRVAPIFTGIGVAMVLISFMVCLYYNVVVMYGMYYLLVSLVYMDGNLPWSTCGNDWNTDFCVRDMPDLTNKTDVEKINITLSRMDRNCVSDILKQENMTMMSKDFTYNFTQTNLTSCDRTIFPSEEFFSNFVLRVGEVKTLEDVGGISIKLVFMLALAWLILFFSLRKGVETSGKIVYFMATFPYVVLIALLVRGVTLEGYMKGIEFYIIPEWEKLKDVNVWREAATQIFYSLGPAFGTLITMASYNPFKHNCYRDAILVAIINCSTSIFAGFVIFSMLGYMATVTNQDVQDVTSSGPGLVFVVYPEGIARMPVSGLWAFLFFFMLIALGLDSQFAMFETVISALVDEFPTVLRKNRVVFTFICHLVGFLFGLPMVTYGGIWVLTLMNSYSANYGLMFTCLCELIAINYVYGNSRFCEDIELMLGFKPNLYWKATWMFITPAAILIMLVVSIIQYQPTEYGDYQFESWVEGIGFVMVGLPILIIILGVIYKSIQMGGVRAAMKPDPLWGPAKEEHRTGRYADNRVTEMDRIEIGGIKTSSQSGSIDNPAASTTSISNISTEVDNNGSTGHRF